jgi:DNA-binding MarR family transcriptional regulator
MDGARFDRQESLGYLVNRAARLFARALEKRLADHGVALGPFPVLLLLWEEEGLTQTEIARRLDVEQPTIANTLKRMERDGLVVFAPDPSSKKRVLVRLTDKARTLEKPLTDEASAVNAAASGALTGEDIRQFKTLLASLAANLEMLRDA